MDTKRSNVCVKIFIISYLVLIVTITNTYLLAGAEVNMGDFKYPKIQVKSAGGIPESRRGNFEYFAGGLKNRDEYLESVKKDYESMSYNVCQAVKRELQKHHILLVEQKADIVVMISVQKAIQHTYANEPIIEEVIAIGYSSDKEIFNIVYTQEKGYIDFRFWKVVKTPKQIGIVLAKDIAKEINKWRKTGAFVLAQ